MKSIGGYFELELNRKTEFHKNAIRLNTGRNAFEYILLTRKYKKVFIPFFTCDVILETINKVGIDYDFYSINKKLEPIFDFNNLKSKNAFLYTNYFGLKNNYIEQLTKLSKKIIIDNAQSFYSKPIKGIDTFYSVRKFFGVPDGAYLYTNATSYKLLNKDFSKDKISHLITRIEKSAEEGYLEFQESEKKLDNQPILEMSNFTNALLQSISYKKIKKNRIDNFTFLNNHLKKVNKLKFEITNKDTPMVYPLWVEKSKEIREKLLENKIYTARYWNNVMEWCNKDDLEYKFANEVIYLPIDQRNSLSEMEFIYKIIKDYL